jgi:hypothetical protein
LNREPGKIKIVRGNNNGSSQTHRKSIENALQSSCNRSTITTRKLRKRKAIAPRTYYNCIAKALEMQRERSANASPTHCYRIANALRTDCERIVNALLMHRKYIVNALLTQREREAIALQS